MIIVCGGPKATFFIGSHWIAFCSSCSKGEILAAISLGLLHTHNLNVNLVLMLLHFLPLSSNLFVLCGLVGFTEG